MNDKYLYTVGFLSRLAELAENDGMVKQAGALKSLTAGFGAMKKTIGQTFGKPISRATEGAATKTFLEQQLAQRKIKSTALENRLQKMVGGPTQVQMAGGGPFPKVPTPKLQMAPEAPLPGAAAGAAEGAASALPDAAANPLSGIQDRIGKGVAGMQPGLVRRLLGGSQFANANPVNPADLGKTVMNRAGGAALGAGALGASNLYGQYSAAEEAKRRASQASFMQRLAFLMNPNVVNQ